MGTVHERSSDETTGVEKFRHSLETLALRVRADAEKIAEQVQSGSGGSGNLSTVPVHLGDMGTDEFMRELDATLLDNEQYLVTEARAACGGSKRERLASARAATSGSPRSGWK